MARHVADVDEPVLVGDWDVGTVGPQVFCDRFLFFKDMVYSNGVGDREV